VPRATTAAGDGVVTVPIGVEREGRVHLTHVPSNRRVNWPGRRSRRYDLPDGRRLRCEFAPGGGVATVPERDGPATGCWWSWDQAGKRPFLSNTRMARARARD
jgi:hypothetical protein